MNRVFWEPGTLLEVGQMRPPGYRVHCSIVYKSGRFKNHMSINRGGIICKLSHSGIQLLKSEVEMVFLQWVNFMTCTLYFNKVV